MKKITTLIGAARFSALQKKQGKSVGLVVGSFDIVHLGHLNLFRFAKKHADFLIVGLDNDQTISWVKGKNRPINNSRRRSLFLQELATVDKIFVITRTSHHDSEAAQNSYREILTTIKPTHVFTHPACDKHWRLKKDIVQKKHIVFMADFSRKITHSGDILRALLATGY